MYEIFLTLSFITLGIIFVASVYAFSRLSTRQIKQIHKLIDTIHEMRERLYELEIGKFHSENRVIEFEFKRMDHMDRLVTTLRRVQKGQNQIILKSAGFSREEVAELVEKQTAQGVYSLMDELKIAHYLQTDAELARLQGEREEISPAHSLSDLMPDQVGDDQQTNKP